MMVTSFPGKKLAAPLNCVFEPLQMFVLSIPYPGKGFCSAISTAWKCTHCTDHIYMYFRYIHACACKPKVCEQYSVYTSKQLELR